MKQMWNGKKKAFTLSFDDGVIQDVRLVQLLDKYGLKATFNINSGMFGVKNSYQPNGRVVVRDRIEPQQAIEAYRNHEVAVHTVGHFNLTQLPDSCITLQVEEDRKLLERLFGYKIRCMAYPCGGVNNDDHVAEVIQKTTKIQFARTNTSCYSLEPQSNLLRFHPTLAFVDERLFALAEAFLNAPSDKPQLFYVWGHAYELDAEEGAWERFEEFCRLIAGKQDVFYATNSQIFIR